jgi:Fur family transcriptional regulator, ferric uptake regulator
MDAKSRQLLQKVLKDKGFSMTAVRLTVCELLWSQEPMSMRELAAQSADKLDRTSLYRTIGLFERLGLVRRIYIGWKYKVELSDVFTHHHHHIVCTQCGKIVAMTEDEKIEHLIAMLAKRYGFSADSHQLEISGRCSECLRQIRS